jgi:hypothetical protein
VLINDIGDVGDVGEVEPIPGGFYSVEITDSLEYDLIGRIIPSPSGRGF